MLKKIKIPFAISLSIISIFLLVANNFLEIESFKSYTVLKFVNDKNIGKISRRNKTKEEIKATFEHREKVMKLG